MKSFKVSIVIPVYNGSDYLGEAIDSALSQTHENKEIIVINDGSDDGGKTSAVALSYGNRIRYYEKENGGVASALNLGISMMAGDYFSWLSHDDIYYDKKIETQINWYEKYAIDAILFSDFELVDENGNYLQTVELSESALIDFRLWITQKSSLNGCTLLIPKKCFDVCGVFNVKLKTTQDYDLWFRMAEKYRFIRIPEVLVMSRQHADQETKKLNKIVIQECNLLVISFYNTLMTQKKGLIDSDNIALCFYKRGFYLASYYVFSQTNDLSSNYRAIAISLKRLLYKYLSLLRILLKQRFLYKHFQN